MKQLKCILRHFPECNEFVFAYGSAVFKQSWKNSQNNMIDLIFVVNHPLSWHEINLQNNYDHYSFLKYGKSKLISNIQENFGAKVYFNTLINIENMMIKYGIISYDAFITDLLDWNFLYVSGRLHKPVLVLRESKNQNLITALRINLQTAIHTALLLLPSSFSEEDLYMAICGLSYIGDFRMIVGEDRKKIPNIVKHQYNEFRELYDPIINSFSHWLHIDSNRQMFQDVSPLSKLYHISMLPKHLQTFLVSTWNRNWKNGRKKDVEDILQAISYDNNNRDLVLEGINKIVRLSSIKQSVKGIFTAGILKSFKYSSKKLQKMLNSLFNKSL